ncbi:uncharacterized protein FA14DRAFT_158586 [Meira miltonrushii]|uniref:Secreted protein n=1 Tax=Meira miltonrushii TaxID=1280837 RepID=A0A316V3E5_9BASI|nr:uncharacterized protein FA14DRAFT_158586 [Meira miltonrushii]PWN31774.1 hypothetical protein FA14DRAFT_158586 [Meira miltonrushii]
MRFFHFLALTLISLSVLLGSSKACDQCDVTAAQNAGVPTDKHVYVYFKEMAMIIKQLANAQSSANIQGPPDFSQAEKGLFALGKVIDQATQVLQVYQGTLDSNNAHHIDKYLAWSAKDVVKITTMIKYAKPYSDQQGYTGVIVHILQGITSQISILFQLLEMHMPPSSYASSSYSISVFICAMADAIEYLQPNSCTSQGKQFCANISRQSSSSCGTTSYRKKCSSVVKVPNSFKQCGNSAAAMYEYGYKNKCLGSKHHKSKWCSGKKKVYKHPKVSDYSSKSSSSSSSSSSTSTTTTTSSSSTQYTFSYSACFTYTPSASDWYCSGPSY